jgi:hypothetical protein
MYAKDTLADLTDPFVQSGTERETKQELSSQRLRAAQSDPVTTLGRVLALVFCVCVFAAVAIGIGVVLFGPHSNSSQSNPVRVINAPGITTYSSPPQNRLAEATPNYNTPSNQPLTLGVGKDIPTPSSWGKDMPTPSSWGKDTVTPQPQTTWWSKLREYLPEVRFETSPQPQSKTQAAVTPQSQPQSQSQPQPQPQSQSQSQPQPRSQWRSRLLNEAWRWIQARLEQEWDKKPPQPQRSYVPPQRSYLTPQQNVQQNPYQRMQMRDAQLAQQRLQQQLQFERSQGYDRYAPPPPNGWYPVNPRQNYYRQY